MSRAPCQNLSHCHYYLLNHLMSGHQSDIISLVYHIYLIYAAEGILTSNYNGEVEENVIARSCSTNWDKGEYVQFIGGKARGRPLRRNDGVCIILR
jgi:hypothetical protein